MLGFRAAQAFCSRSEQGRPSCGARASHCGGSPVAKRAMVARAQRLWHTGLIAPCPWGLPRPRVEPMYPALAVRYCQGARDQVFLSIIVTVALKR